MKKKTRTIVIMGSVFLLSLFALAPVLFHKRATTSSNEIIASKVELVKVQEKEPVRTNPPAPVSSNKLQEPVVKTVPKPVSNQDLPVAKASLPEPVKTTPRNPLLVLKNKIQPKMNEDKTLISKNDRPYVEKKPVIPKQSQKVEPDSPVTTAAPKKPSPWGVVLLASNSGMDGGVSYRMGQIPVLNGIDLDLIAGSKQAGLGLSKYVYWNLGLGLTGTVTYNSGEKNLGVYGKYSF